MIRRPPRSTPLYSSAASDVYKRQVWDTPANFNGFRVLASLLHQSRSTEVNQTLHDVWPSPELVWYIYTFGGSCPDGILPGAKFTLRPSLAFSYIGSVTARHSSSGVSQTLRRGTSNGITELSQRAPPVFGWMAWPSRWASAHIVVSVCFVSTIA